MKDKIEKEIRNLERKADQNRSIHGMIKDRYDSINKYVMIFLTIGSAITAMIIFADIPSNCKLIGGGISAFIFIVSLFPNAMKYDHKIEERGIAVQLWGEWIRDAKHFVNVDINTLSIDEISVKGRELMESYKVVMNNTPAIPDCDFNVGKQKHLQKVEISKALGKNPFKSIKEIKKELKNNR